ncbi:Radical SAM domain protein [Ferroglobus placidus DSM 10642]|uniref:Radical SAM domain protein n=1 Tax=Ferroglobus placidus (strain DSM 10642 / AEDII12DO) TaxID=589924 RepID=D3RXE8_FERPA|nr:radical SAM protein [Ferroglobus placidus]ADC65161.1 Radical SAM domain protein [Ferroglobus placidus DSM 10642]
MSYKLLAPFDPWKSKLCTCPAKLSFNPYTGCNHRCLYCYSTYIPNFFNARPKERLLIRLEKELREIKAEALISMSNSSDPYPEMEKSLELTRASLEMFKERGLKVLVITKSDLVTRDIDILKDMKSAVAITITTLDESLAEKIEPNAPSPKRRLRALKKVKEAGIPAILRLDPVIPFLNENVEEVLERAKFVDHVVSSTLKLRADSFSRLSKAFPELKEKFKELYFKQGEKIGGSWYLRRELRVKLLSKVAEKCEELNLSYAFCREGIPFKAKSCDGSHLLLN